MAKKIDITEKLHFDEDPVLVICGQELTVHSDAETMLRLMGTFVKNNELQAVGEALELIFDPEDLEKLYTASSGGKKLSARSMMTIVQEAMSLVMGESEGEQ